MQNWIIRLLARYLGWCARRIINRAPKDIITIGITGSTGKTSTKEMMGLLIKEKIGAGVVISPGNLNNEIGLPLAILGFTQTPSFWQYPAIKLQALWRALTMNPATAYVLEFGVDHPGDMDQLLKIVKPTDVILTNIGPVHLEFFSGLDKLIAEKIKLANAARGKILINGDDKHLEKERKELGDNIKTFGRREDCDLKLIKFTIETDKTQFAVVWQGKEESYEIAALGKHHVMSVLPAILYGYLNNFGDDQIKSAILQYRPLAGRGNVVAGKKSSIIINETYNANPLSMKMALEVLGTMKLSPKIAVLGDMLELGDKSHQEHEVILQLAKEKADLVITVGPRMKEVGLADKAFESPVDAAEYLDSRLERDSVILVKGSQGMRTEMIVEKIMRNPEEADKLLPRKSAGWLKTPFKPV